MIEYYRTTRDNSPNDKIDNLMAWFDKLEGKNVESVSTTFPRDASHTGSTTVAGSTAGESRDGAAGVNRGRRERKS